MRATVAIVEGLATTDLEQVFRNYGPMPAEEEYLFPLPDDAVARDLSLWIDGKEVKAELAGEMAPRIHAPPQPSRWSPRSSLARCSGVSGF